MQPNMCAKFSVIIQEHQPPPEKKKRFLHVSPLFILPHKYFFSAGPLTICPTILMIGLSLRGVCESVQISVGHCDVVSGAQPLGLSELNKGKKEVLHENVQLLHMTMVVFSGRWV